jgi:N-acetyl-alpha-D-glucosaminyl L-malate synthase BshA
MIKPDHPLKVVTTLHGTDITLVGQENSFYTVTKFSIEHSDAVTTVSEFLREETYRAFGCQKCGIEVIPNFVDLVEHHPEGDCEHRKALAPAGAKVIVHVSNFRPVKRVPEVVRVFAGIKKRIPAVLVLVGDGPERPNTEAVVEELGLHDDVRFLGKLSPVADILRAADLFLLPSMSESFGLSALEAMACGVPVIASAVGGLAEVVENGETGVLVPADQLEQMVDEALDLLTDHDKWCRMRDAAVERAQFFTPDRIVPQYEAVYRKALEQ